MIFCFPGGWKIQIENEAFGGKRETGVGGRAGNFKACSTFKFDVDVR